MIVIEFYLKSGVPEEAFETLCNTFYNIPSPIVRRVDGQTASAVFAVSKNPNTRWVQLLVDDNAPVEVITAIEARIQGLCDTKPAKYTSAEDHVAPPERPREVVGV
jgi:hypothetical protein